MFTIRGKLLIYALEIIAAVLLLVSIPPWNTWWIQVGLALLSVSALVLALLMGRSIAIGMDVLVAATRRIGRGQYDEPVPGGGMDEIGMLATEIDRMRVLLREKVRQLEDLSRHLEQKVEERTRQLQLANDRLAVIHEVINAVNSRLDFQDIFGAVVSGTRRLIDFDQASIARVVDSSHAIVFAISGEHSELSEGRKIPLSGSRIGEVFRSRRPATFDRPPHQQAGEDSLMMSLIVREVVLPLIAGDQVIGTFNLGSRRPDAFSADEVEVLSQIAGEIGVALLRAEAFERERTAAQKLKDLSDLKSEFVSKVSHELRTPLTSILGAVDNLIDGIAGPLEAKPVDYLLRVRDNGNRLLLLINDLLDLSRIEAGENKIDPRRFVLDTLIGETLETLRPLAKERGVTLRAMPGPPLTVVADRDKIGRVLLNLLHNGIKFTEPGGRVEVSTANGAAGYVEVRVRDTGIGIPPGEIHRIFDKFHQVKRSGDPRAPGSGLGLSISRELVAMHGGELTVKSSPGAGSTFTMTVPAAAENPGEEHP